MSIWLLLAILFTVLLLVCGSFYVWAVASDVITSKKEDGCTSCFFISLTGASFVGALVFWIVWLFTIGVIRW